MISSYSLETIYIIKFNFIKIIKDYFIYIN